jgi:hypothetical protein
VEKRRKKEELLVLKSKARPSFGDAAFADDEALATAAESVADECPFFESGNHNAASFHIRARLINPPVDVCAQFYYRCGRDGNRSMYRS